MLTLRRSSRQVVVADAQFDGPDMIGKLLGERQRLAHQTGDALPQRVVEALNVIGLTRQFADRFMLRSRNDPGPAGLPACQSLKGQHVCSATVGFRFSAAANPGTRPGQKLS